jgi:amino acid transporter
MNWHSNLLNILCLIAQFYIAVSPVEGSPNAEAFFQAYLAVPIVILFYVVWKIWKRTPFRRPATIDLTTGRRSLDTQELVAEERAERATWPIWKRIYFTLC